MDLSKMSIRDIEKAAKEMPDSIELFEACQADPRAAVQRVGRRIERELQERARVEALYSYEKEAREEGFEAVAGVDEAGRGPLAGPVVVAAVILPFGLFLPKLNDSKKLSEKAREELFELIMKNAVAVKVSVVDEKTIDRVNIYQATINGMYEAVLGLEPQPQKVLIDAVPLERLNMPSLSIIKGDAKSASIAAASIIAKVTRDRLMKEYDREYPEYGFAQHKGYGTARHIDAIRKYGICPIHRRSFEPISSMI